MRCVLSETGTPSSNELRRSGSSMTETKGNCQRLAPIFIPSWCPGVFLAPWSEQVTRGDDDDGGGDDDDGDDDPDTYRNGPSVASCSFSTTTSYKVELGEQYGHHAGKNAFRFVSHGSWKFFVIKTRR